MKKQFLFLSTVTFCVLGVFAQTPFDNFAPEQSVKPMIELSEMQFKVTNTDTNSIIRYLELDRSARLLYLLDDNGSIIAVVELNDNDKKWLSVDPMSDKYPSHSPYNYCANNPLKFIDADGREIWVAVGGGVFHKYEDGHLVGRDGVQYKPSSNTYQGKVLNNLNALAKSKDVTVRGRFNDLVTSKHIHQIKNTTGTNGNEPKNSDDAYTRGTGSGSTTYFNPDAERTYPDGATWSPTASLGHELLGHGWDNDMGLNSDATTENGIPMKEVSAINIQNIILLEQDPNNKIRTTHGEKDAKGNLLYIPKNLNKYFTEPLLKIAE